MAAVLLDHDPDKLTPKDGSTPPEGVVDLLMGYKSEGEEARKSGPDGRDDIWDANVDLYWGRFDFSKKADWQAREVMPEAAVFVDRWAAAMSEALTTNPEWFTVVVPGDKEGDLTQGIIKFMNVHLGKCGRNQLGQVISFPTVFEEQMKLGALMAVCSTVTWKQSSGKGYVAVDSFDPRSLWLDPKGRGLYRFRRTEIDLHELIKLAKLQDGEGNPIYNLSEILALTEDVSTQMQIDKERLTGHGQNIISKRKPIVLLEFLATIIDSEGKIIGENQLCVVANDTKLIRGPEKNPFWHQKDWCLYTPLITVPLAPYGKSYIENWGGVAKAFVEMTNLILDGARAAAMNAHAVDPGQLEDVSQLTDGVSPNKLFILEEGGDVDAFMSKIEMGNLPPEVVTIWQALKKELQEGSNQSELALGQFPTKSRITATEIKGAERGGSALIASMSRTVEGRHLEPTLDLIWRTALQHMEEDDPEMSAIVGPRIYKMIFARRRELAESNVSFPVKGISAVIERGEKLQKLIGVLGVIGQNDIMVQSLFEAVPPQSLIREIFKLAGLDLGSLEPTEREQQLDSLSKQIQPQGQPGAPQQPPS